MWRKWIGPIVAKLSWRCLHQWKKREIYLKNSLSRSFKDEALPTTAQKCYLSIYFYIYEHPSYFQCIFTSLYQTPPEEIAHLSGGAVYVGKAIILDFCKVDIPNASTCARNIFCVLTIYYYHQMTVLIISKVLVSSPYCTRLRHSTCHKRCEGRELLVV